MILIYVEGNKMLPPLRVYPDNKHFPKNSSVNQVNKKRNIHVNFANVLGVAFAIPSGSLLLVKYPLYLVARSFSLKE
jgi:hypothetical protein